MQNHEDQNTIIEIPISDGAPATSEEATAETPLVPETPAETTTNESVAQPQPDSLSENEDKFKRLAADFANYKRRAEVERNELLDLLEARLLNGILAIYDDFCRLSQHSANVNEQLAQGLKAVQTKWQAWLANENVETINPAGQSFDPHFHDALMQMPVATVERDGQVINVIENGYKRRDKVLRHAKVIVGHFEAEEPLPQTIAQEEPGLKNEENVTASA